MGVMGACRSNELYNMKVEHIQYYDGCVQVLVPTTKTKIPRNFTITGDYYNIVRKYADLRPSNVPNSFFLNYQNGKCTKQIIGINKFGQMGKTIAEYLQLINPEKYTGHCLRRSSATLYADGGATMTALKRHGGWKSACVAEGYIAESKKTKIDAANKILKQINSKLCPSTSTTVNNVSSETFSITNKNDMNISNIPAPIHFHNCSNFTINFMKN